MEWIEPLKNVSILIGVWVAIYGIDSWRREHTGKRQIELAEDTLALFYEAVDVIKHIRHPASFSNETEDIERKPRETDSEYQARKNASIVFNRYNNHQELFNKLHAMRYRYMAQIGKEEAKPFDDLRAVINQITFAARMLATLWPRDYFNSEDQKERHWEQIQKHEAVFWDSMGDDDPINPKLDSIITTMETTCQKVISDKGTIYSYINMKLGKNS